MKFGSLEKLLSFSFLLLALFGNPSFGSDYLKLVDGQVIDRALNVSLANAYVRINDYSNGQTFVGTDANGLFSKNVKIPKEYVCGYQTYTDPFTGETSTDYSEPIYCDNYVSFTILYPDHYLFNSTPVDINVNSDSYTQILKLEYITSYNPQMYAKGACKVNDNLFQSDSTFGCRDKKTSLLWGNTSTVMMTYNQAVNFCAALPGLRLAQVGELTHVTTGNNWLTHFNFDATVYFWSSTDNSTAKKPSSSAYIGRISDNSSKFVSKSTLAYPRLIFRAPSNLADLRNLIKRS